MKKILSNTLKALAVVALGVGVIYASGNLIKTLNQTAYQGDKITPDWINAVNKRLTTPNPTALPVFFVHTGSYTDNPTVNTNNRNQLITNTMNLATRGANNDVKALWTTWKDLCEVSGAPTSYSVDGYKNNGDVQGTKDWCAHWICAYGLNAEGAIFQMIHCGDGNAACKKGGYTIDCLYTDD